MAKRLRRKLDYHSMDGPHQEVEGNGVAKWAKAEAESVSDSVQRSSLCEKSSAFASRGITGAKTNDTAQWIDTHVREERPYRPPGNKRIRKELESERKALAGRYHQFLSGHAAIGSCLCNKIHKIECC